MEQFVPCVVKSCSNNSLNQRRKFMKKVLSSIALFVLLVSCVFMAACSPAGTYKFDSLSYAESGMAVEIKAGEKFLGVTITEDFMTLQLNKDGTGVISFQGESSELTWVKEGDVIKIIANGEPQEFKMDGNKLSINIDGTLLILKK